MNTATLKADPAPSPLLRPIAPDHVRAGFPSPAQDYEEETLDINQYLVRNAPATFFVTVEGDSMINAGIHAGDILVVDRSLQFQSGQIVVAFVGGERLVKRVQFSGDVGYLIAENPAYPPIKITEENPATIWGVVTGKFGKIPV